MFRLIQPRSNFLKRYISHDTTRLFPHDTSKPFPPPQPTRPIDILEQKDKSVMSSELDAIAKDIAKSSSPRQSHHFDTYKILTQLEGQGFTRNQAEVIMKGIKFRLRECTAAMRHQLFLSSDLENESYLFKAALSELKTETQVLRKNNMQMLQAELSLLIREVDILDQRLNEGISTMKNDIQMDMNNRKNETREDQKGMDMKIQEINNKFTIRLGDIRTEIEAVRWETIWKGMTGVCLAGLTIATLGYILTRYSVRKADRLRLEKERKRKIIQEEANRAGTLDMEVIY
ncbi:hypothetical protein BY458DRAFT_560492 [Sporodiniella umbellata]|nr:hypothetical protein BY458DRAFT_560492 [Sporodiniella umbellata]